jgi:poly(3-hydroxybutyrate) depolymerase
MNQRLLLFLVVSNGLLAEAQTVNLRGIVSSGGQPVSGAIVTLMKLGLKDTTGSDGAYAFSQQITSIYPGSSRAGSISLSGGVLEFELAEPSPMAIEVFDIKSNLLKSEKSGVQGAGHYRWNIAGAYPANQLLVVRASVGGKISTFRYMPGSGAHAGQVAFKSSQDGWALAKTAAAIDSLDVQASGYSARKVMVESYDAKLDISVDRADNSGDKWGGLKNPPAKSAGCGKPAGITSGMKTITSGGRSRQYSLDLPPNYDMNTPSRVIFIYHWVGGTAQSMKNNNYYAIRPLAIAANVPTIFIAPTHGASEADHTVFTDILALAKTNLCVDSTRVFSTGYSHGGMMTYSLSTKQQKVLRGAAGIAAANFNVWLPNPKSKEPIAYFGISAMGDRTCPWDGGNNRGSKYIALEKATDNGCEIPTAIPTWKSGTTNHVVYEFKGCKAGYPVQQSTFNGEHGGAEQAKDPGVSVSWVPKEIWDFFMRF